MSACIAKLQYFCEGHLGSRPFELVYDDEQYLRYFNTVVQAQEFVDKRQESVYVLEWGEYAAPDYVIIDAKTAEYIDSGRNEDLSNYDWDDAECGCGECRTCFDMMDEQDLQLIKNAQLGKEY